MALAASKTGPRVYAQDAKEDGYESWALLSDTHIAADPELKARGVSMAGHLQQAVEEVLQAHESRAFSGFMINGDCAYLEGHAADYTTLGKLIKPISEKGIPMHLTLGNHDERTHIQGGLASVFDASKMASLDARETPNLEGKLASKIRGRFCDWYLLDSLDVTNKTPGRLGEKQIAWLDASLQATPERPALVMVHHNPQPAGTGKVLGLMDTDALLSLLLERRQVKALFFGHTHVATTLEVGGLHLVNLPACAYHFNASQPTGWTSALVDPKGCSLRLFDTAKAHPLHGTEVRLNWRQL